MSSARERRQAVQLAEGARWRRLEGDLLPTTAGPVHDSTVADRPDVVAGEREDVAEGADVELGLLPGRAVVVRHQCLVGTTVSIDPVADGPDVVRGHLADAVELLRLVTVDARRHGGPRRAVEVLNERVIAEEARAVRRASCADRPRVIRRQGVDVAERVDDRVPPRLMHRARRRSAAQTGNQTGGQTGARSRDRADGRDADQVRTAVTRVVRHRASLSSL